MKTFNKILNLIYPPKCAICGRINKNYICESCYRRLYSDTVGAHCMCPHKYKINTYKNKFFSKHIYIFKYKGIIREKILQYKFGDKGFLKDFFMQIILRDKTLCNYLKRYDAIIPVPISKERLKERGYNQTELISKEISKKLEIRYIPNGLIKYKNTKPQSTLSKRDRIENVQNAYKIRTKEDIYNKKIILFDDIYTTGSTVNECSKILKQNGVKEIVVLTLAKD